MTVFKAFLHILNKNKFIVILYTTLLIVFGGLNIKTSENNISFTASKPSVMIVNEDVDAGITKDLIKYIENNTNIKDIKNTEDDINDAIFYREISYVIFIPENYNQDFLDGKSPELKIKSLGDYNASLTEMLLKRYLNVANIYKNSISDENELISKINETLAKETSVTITSKLDVTALDKAAFYFNFESYSILACLIYVICLILSTFNNEKIRKRNIISSTDYKKTNCILLLSNSLYAFVLWLFYLVFSFILVGSVMFIMHGLVYTINSLLFTLCATTIAFLIGTIVQNKNAISGIVNVVALGSSFLCGAFVPMEWLPEGVLNFAHALPTYYYIKTNELLKTVEVFSLDTMKPLLINMAIIIIFSLVFIILANIVSKRKQKLG